MKQIPIIFSTPMVQALLEGRKTQTRRLCKRQPRYDETYRMYDDGTFNICGPDFDSQDIKCPYGQPGDVLWVRETWCLTQPFDPETYYFGYKCGIAIHSERPAPHSYDFLSPDIWRPSIHMPRAAARIFLRVTGVRVERLNDISEDDAIAEGIVYTPAYNPEEDLPSLVFSDMWESINGPGSWEANPWVWVITFERVDDPLSTTQPARR